MKRHVCSRCSTVGGKKVLISSLYRFQPCLLGLETSVVEMLFHFWLKTLKNPTTEQKYHQTALSLFRTLEVSVFWLQVGLDLLIIVVLRTTITHRSSNTEGMLTVYCTMCATAQIQYGACHIGCYTWGFLAMSVDLLGWDSDSRVFLDWKLKNSCLWEQTQHRLDSFASCDVMTQIHTKQNLLEVFSFLFFRALL